VGADEEGAVVAVVEDAPPLFVGSGVVLGAVVDAVEDEVAAAGVAVEDGDVGRAAVERADAVLVSAVRSLCGKTILRFYAVVRLSVALSSFVGRQCALGRLVTRYSARVRLRAHGNLYELPRSQFHRDP